MNREVVEALCRISGLGWGSFWTRGALASKCRNKCNGSPQQYKFLKHRIWKILMTLSEIMSRPAGLDQLEKRGCVIGAWRAVQVRLSSRRLRVAFQVCLWH